jgi:short-subunit dehydrogenase
MTERAIVVTGASSGIGAAFAERCAGEGARLVLTGRSAEGLAAAAARVRRAGGGEPLLLTADLIEPDAPARLFAEVAAAGLELDVLVNNAGLGFHGAAADLPVERQLETVDVNVRAATELALRALPGMIARRRGGIVNVASVAAFVPGPHMAVYYASKAYLLSFSEAVAAEVAGTGVVVTAVCPGPTHSDFGRRAGFSNPGLVDRYGAQSAEQVADMGWRGFKAGRRVVVTGARNKFAAAAARFAPHALSVSLLARLQRARAMR